MIRAVGKRYDGHPDLESVDLAIVGAWGEGAGSDELTERTRQALVDSYLDAFHKTPLVMMLSDAKTNTYGISRRADAFEPEDHVAAHPDWLPAT